MNRFMKMMLALSFFVFPIQVRAGIEYSEIEVESTQTTTTAKADDLLDSLIESKSNVPSMSKQSFQAAEHPQLSTNYTDSIIIADSVETAPRKTGFRPAKPKLSERMVFITGQRENHLLINVGDLVYLLTLENLQVKQDDHYIIFKQVKKIIKKVSDKPITWFDPVGKLKILETNQPLSIGRVIAARGIIQKGDFIFIGKGAHE